MVVDLVEEFASLGKALKWKIYHFIGFFRKRLRWAFSFESYTLQAWDPPTFPRILRFNFSYETDFRVNSFVAQKSSEMSPLSGSPVFVSQPLASETF